MEKDIVYNFYTLVYYADYISKYGNTFDRIYAYFYWCCFYKKDIINFPCWLEEFGDGELPRIFWSLLVMLYGKSSYGLKYGYIPLKSAELIITQIEKFYKTFSIDTKEIYIRYSF